MKSHDKTGRWLGIDLLRFLAALLVALHHTSFAAEEIAGFPTPIGAHYAFSFITKYGYLGYQFFFVISGFVILHSAFNKTPGQFLIARFLRLYPAFWICCTLTFLGIMFFLPYGVRGLAHSSHDYFLNLTLLYRFLNVPPVDGPYWTLNYEIAFYGWIFLLLSLRLIRHYEWILLAGLIFSVTLWLDPHYGAVARFTPQSIFLLHGFFGYFALGSVIFLIQHQGKATWRTALIAGISIFLIFVQLQGNYPIFNNSLRPEYSGNLMSLTTTLIIFASMIAVFIAAVRAGERFSYKTSWLFLGNVSYPFYLLHQTLGIIIINLALPIFGPNSALLLSLIVIFALASAVHKWGEVPLRQFLIKCTSGYNRRKI